MIVKSASPGSNVWNYSYACNGGGFSSLGNSGGENFSYASPRVETFRFGPAGSTLFILDYHNAIGHYDSYGNLFRNMGLMVCVLGMPGTYGVPNGNPATAWQTASSGGASDASHSCVARAAVGLGRGGGRAPPGNRRQLRRDG